jgi:hypothetical protein
MDRQMREALHRLGYDVAEVHGQNSVSPSGQGR